MLFRLLSETTIEQVPSEAFPARNKKIIFPFMCECQVKSSWKDLTDGGKIILPKNVYVKDDTGKLVSLYGTNKNIGGFSNNNPIFLRGDKITIKAGYRYFDLHGNEVSPMNILIDGYITKVESKSPIQIHFEDSMYLLKQLPVANKSFPASQYTLEKILQEITKGSGLNIRKGVQTNMGDFKTQNETVCEVLARLEKDYHFPSYIRNGELRTGFPIYVEQDAIDDGLKTFIFNRHPTYGKNNVFQGSVIKDSLTYNRKEDVNLSAIAYSINKKELEATTSDGATKTRKERLEVLVEFRNGNFLRTVKQPGSRADFSHNNVGERRTLYFWNISDANRLGDLAQQELEKYYYTGFKGKFTTFGLPFVRFGDNIRLVDLYYPERNGVYRCKSVEYEFGASKGFKQHVELDYRIS